MQFGLNLKNSSLHSQLYIRSNDPVGNIGLAKRIIVEEYKKYPGIVTSSKLKLVNLVSNLRVKNNSDVDKYVRNSESPDPEAGWMYIDVDYLADEEYFRQCINHEIWHLYDFALTGSFNPNDTEWVALNPKDFKYGPGGWVGYHTEFENKLYPRDGFITSYATLGIDEDKAETFMYYFTDHLKPKLKEAMKFDTVLQEKVRLILEHVQRSTSMY